MYIYIYIYRERDFRKFDKMIFSLYIYIYIYCDASTKHELSDSISLAGWNRIGLDENEIKWWICEQAYPTIEPFSFCLCPFPSSCHPYLAAVNLASPSTPHLWIWPTIVSTFNREFNPEASLRHAQSLTIFFSF